MRGKYSPTVSVAYMKDQNWFEKYAGDSIYDPEGFDSYGYDKNEIDRAGNEESEYYHNDGEYGDYDLEQDYNYAYDSAYYQWTFDGIKPVHCRARKG